MQDIAIILVRTWHPGNIGSAARAMKNMGLTKLRLVAPHFGIDDQAQSMAAGAIDILEQVEVFDTLQEAIADRQTVIGTSARIRGQRVPQLNPKQAANTALEQAPAAIVFGGERSGLTNEDLALCHFQVAIDGNPDYPVLNLAQAVQILCYELFNAQQTSPDFDRQEDPYPLVKELEVFYQRLEGALAETDYMKGHERDEILKQRLRQYFRRSRPTRRELSLLQGVVSALTEK
ncbi:RNA methyltransferase [Salinibius halmophilus]|uniref:RNA methyltransferase n=1 Tax=Salinibius halmophilus TaxID=1853216 RepID=UPI000E6646BE|nr:RNA methyltransferase [Salinibius halmophilus]